MLRRWYPGRELVRTVQGALWKGRDKVAGTEFRLALALARRQQYNARRRWRRKKRRLELLTITAASAFRGYLQKALEDHREAEPRRETVRV